MKNKIVYTNDISHSNVSDSIDNAYDDIPDSINVDWNKPKRNPFVDKLEKNVYELSPDVAKYFKNSGQLNQFLRNQIKEFQKIVR